MMFFFRTGPCEMTALMEMPKLAFVMRHQPMVQLVTQLYTPPPHTLLEDPAPLLISPFM